MRRLESILVKTKTFKMFVMSLKCVLFMSIIAFLSQRKLLLLLTGLRERDKREKSEEKN